jgi:hypothetical protein
MRQKESNTPCIESISHPEKSVNFPKITLARPHGMSALALRGTCRFHGREADLPDRLRGGSKMEEGGFRTGTESKVTDNHINDHRTSGSNRNGSRLWFNRFFIFIRFYILLLTQTL